MSIQLPGVWRSEYTITPDNAEPISFTHDIQFSVGNLLIGDSEPSLSGSRVHLVLSSQSEDDHHLSGTWSERTSPNGPYKGQIFHGLIELDLNEEETRAEGTWSGLNRDNTKEKTGKWILTKLQ